jgi:hypothetical protein
VAAVDAVAAAAAVDAAAAADTETATESCGDCHGDSRRRGSFITSHSRRLSRASCFRLLPGEMKRALRERLFCF